MPVMIEHHPDTIPSFPFRPPDGHPIPQTEDVNSPESAYRRMVSGALQHLRELLGYPNLTAQIVHVPTGGASAGGELEEVAVAWESKPDGSVTYVIDTTNSGGNKLESTVWGIFVPRDDPNGVRWLKVDADERTPRILDTEPPTSLEEMRRLTIITEVLNCAEKLKQPIISQCENMLSKIFTSATEIYEDGEESGIDPASVPVGVREISRSEDVEGSLTLSLTVPGWVNPSGDPIGVIITRKYADNSNRYKYTITVLGTTGNSSVNPGEDIGRTWELDLSTVSLTVPKSPEANLDLEEGYEEFYEQRKKNSLRLLLQGTRVGLRAQRLRIPKKKSKTEPPKDDKKKAGPNTSD